MSANSSDIKSRYSRTLLRSPRCVGPPVPVLGPRLLGSPKSCFVGEGPGIRLISRTLLIYFHIIQHLMLCNPTDSISYFLCTCPKDWWQSYSTTSHRCNISWHQYHNWNETRCSEEKKWDWNSRILHWLSRVKALSVWSMVKIVDWLNGLADLIVVAMLQRHATGHRHLSQIKTVID
jgi:hypothetical protein